MKLTHLDVEKQIVTVEGKGKYQLSSVEKVISSDGPVTYLSVFLEKIQDEMPELKVGDAVKLISLHGTYPILTLDIESDFITVARNWGHMEDFHRSSITKVWRRGAELWQRD